MESDLERELDTVRTMEKHYKHDIDKMEDRRMWSDVRCEDRDKYASKGLAGTALGVGIPGTIALANQLFGGGGLWGNRQNGVGEKELNMSIALASKDSQIAILQGEKNVNQKIIETLHYVDDKFERQAERITAKYEKLESRIVDNEKAQLVFNGQVNTAIAGINGTLGCQQKQLDELIALTQRSVRNDSVCPGWGPVCVQPIPCAPGTGNTGIH